MELQNLPGLSDTPTLTMQSDAIARVSQVRHRSLILLLSSSSAISLTSRNHQRDENFQNYILEDV